MVEVPVHIQGQESVVHNHVDARLDPGCGTHYCAGVRSTHIKIAPQVRLKVIRTKLPLVCDVDTGANSNKQDIKVAHNLGKLVAQVNK